MLPIGRQVFNHFLESRAYTCSGYFRRQVPQPQMSPLPPFLQLLFLGTTLDGCGICLWPLLVSCPDCASSQFHTHPPAYLQWGARQGAERETEKDLHSLSNSPNSDVLSTLFYGNIRAAMKKIDSTPARPSTT